jgi:SH3 domain protein
MLRFLIFALLLAALHWSAAAPAQTAAYVTDQLEATLRRGTGTEYAIVRMMPAGTPVEVLEVDAASGYSRVRTTQGAEGWILTRYLMDEPAARDQLETLRRRLQEALAQRGSAGELLDAMAAERDTLAAERDELERSRDALSRELAELTAAAAEPLRLRERNLELDQQVEALQAELTGEQIANRELRRNTQRDWFVAGAAVLLLGLVLGVVLPRIRWRRRSRYGDF